MSFEIIRLRLWLPVVFLLLAGCAGHTKPPTPVVVYPPPPDEPKFYFERTLRVSTDVEGISGMDRFRMAVTGSVQVVDGLVKPFGIATYKGRVFITDTVARSVKVFDLTQNKYFEFGTDEPGALAKPLGIDVSAKGEVFVSDNTRKRVAVYTVDGKFLRAIGGPKLFSRPSGLAVNRQGTRLYVVDTGGVQSINHHVYMFDAQSGELIKTIGNRGNADGDFNLPLQAATANDGTLYVVDSGNFRVQAFDADGHFRSKFGTIGRRSGQFARPKGIAVDGYGRVYVVDTAFGNFQIFTGDGKLLLFVGNRSERAGPANFMLPAGIDVDEDGRVYVVDQFFRKVDIFRPAHLKPQEGWAAMKKR